MTTKQDQESDEEEEYESSSDDMAVDEIPPKVSNTGSRIIVQTAFDSYFLHNKPGRIQTSSNVFSELVLPLTAEEYATAIQKSGKGQLVRARILQDADRKALFSRFMSELHEGFNILCYGLGSKRRILNQFAKECCSNRGHVVIANGFRPESSLKDVLNSIENLPDIQKLDLPSTAIEKQARRICNFFNSSKIHLYLVVHNIDAAPFRASKANLIFPLLAHNPRIHLIASIDHINAPLLWSTSEIFARKPEEGDDAATTPPRGFAWLWHDLTTLASYDFELSFADRTSLSGAHYGGARRKADIGAHNITSMSETAASHILTSVTQKAQKLFTLLGNKQLEAIESAGEGTNNNNNSKPQQVGLGYDVLFSAARDNFIATNDTALRALLTEFRDHDLIVSTQAGAGDGGGGGGGGEVLWIPMHKERLANVLQTLTKTS